MNSIDQQGLHSETFPSVGKTDPAGEFPPRADVGDQRISGIPKCVSLPLRGSERPGMAALIKRCWRAFILVPCISLVLPACTNDPPDSAKDPAPVSVQANAPIDPVKVRLKTDAALAPFVSQAYKDESDGQTWIALRESDVRKISASATEGHGMAQAVLAEIVDQIDPQANAAFTEIADLLCGQAEQRFVQAMRGCILARLRQPSEEQDDKKLIELIHEYRKYSDDYLPDCADPRFECRYARLSGQPNRVKELLSAMDSRLDVANRECSFTSGSGCIDAVQKAMADPTSEFAYVDALATNKAIRAVTINSREFERFGDRNWNRLLKLHDATVTRLSQLEPSTAAEFGAAKDCIIAQISDGSDLSCLDLGSLARENPRSLLLAPPLTCKRKLLFWEAVQSHGLPISGYDLSRTGQCLLDGDGVAHRYEAGRKLLAAYFVAEDRYWYGAHITNARYFLDPMFGPPDPRLAYFVLEVGQKHELKEYHNSDPIRRELVTALGHDEVGRIQNRVRMWDKASPDEIHVHLAMLGFPVIDLLGSAESAEGQHGTSQGSGFLVTKDGHIVTNAHVVEGCSSVLANQGSKVEVIGVDRAADLALLKTSPGGKPLPIRERAIRLGESVVTGGYPLSNVSGNQFTVTAGNVSALAGPGGDSRLFQMSAPIQPGSSGGPVFDESGNVVGVAASTLNVRATVEAAGTIPQNVNYAIRSGHLFAFLAANGVDADAEILSGTQEPAEIAASAETSVLHLLCRRSASARN